MAKKSVNSADRKMAESRQEAALRDISSDLARDGLFAVTQTSPVVFGG